jgi:hypothetical protein
MRTLARNDFRLAVRMDAKELKINGQDTRLIQTENFGMKKVSAKM